MIDILLATYNGEKFLAEQINSILAQTFDEWRLLIRDDGSTDATRQIITDFFQRYPDKIVVIDDTDKNLGVTHNFERLMEHSNAPYVMFCDQDDIWFPDKIEKSLQALHQMEQHYPSPIPLLVYTNLSVCNAGGIKIHDSFWEYQKINPLVPCDYPKALLQNNATGNTMIFNRTLIDQALPFPKEAVMHDWWIALVALYLGKITLLTQPTLLYRQHEKNVSGPKGTKLFPLLKKGLTYCATLKNTILQSKSFLYRYQTILTHKQIGILEVFGAILKQNRLLRAIHLLRHRFLSWSDFKDIVKFVVLLVCPREKQK